MVRLFRQLVFGEETWAKTSYERAKDEVQLAELARAGGAKAGAKASGSAGGGGGGGRARAGAAGAGGGRSSQQISGALQQTSGAASAGGDSSRPAAPLLLAEHTAVVSTVQSLVGAPRGSNLPAAGPPAPAPATTGSMTNGSMTTGRRRRRRRRRAKDPDAVSAAAEDFLRPKHDDATKDLIRDSLAERSGAAARCALCNRAVAMKPLQ